CRFFCRDPSMRHQHHCASKTRVVPDRRTVVTTLGAAAVLSSASASLATSDDERFMRLAIDEARQGDYPFGAIIVRDGVVLARGRNLGRTNDDPTAHGEMVAIHRCLANH